MKKHTLYRLLLLLIIALAVASYYLIPAVNSQINRVFFIFSSMSVENVVGFIRSFGVYAAVISFFLMVFQSLAAPLPAFLITFSNAAVFGWLWGAVLSWTSSMVGAYLCFMIARIAGRDMVERLTSKFAIQSVDKYFERYGSNTILIVRLLPFISFDFVSYGAGLTSMNVSSFLIATGIGQLPATLIYSYVGTMLTGDLKTVVMAMFILFALFGIIFLWRQIYEDKQRANN